VNLHTLHWLCSPEGQTLLDELAASDLAESSVLPTLTRLRARYPPELARAAVELVLLRRRARAKFSAAEHMYFTREALEQASSEHVANHRARRFAGYGHVADVCCGIGGDMLALARAGCHVAAVERDELRLMLAQANAAALGLEQRISFVQADVLTTPPPPAEALFCDPGRRAGGKRRFSVEQYEPPLSHVLRWQAQTPALAVKLSPGIDTAELAEQATMTDVGPHELEFVSLAGELKEAVLWCGPLAAARRRATVLRPDAPAAALTDEEDEQGAQQDAPSLAPPARFLYEPDPAVIRAGLVAHLARQTGAAQLDASIAYLSAPHLLPTPFARAWAVREWLPFNLKQLRARLRDLGAGTVTVKKRGSPLDTDRLARQLTGRGRLPLVVVLTRVQGQPAALICEQQAG
jgi:SAM-dependent methyltransferase